MNQRIKLTAAQQTIVQKRQMTGTLDGHWWLIDDLDLALAQVRAAVDDVLTWSYTEENAGAIFATRYLLRKMEKTADTPAPTIPAMLTTDDMTPGAWVHLKEDPQQTFRVIHMNKDGSVCVYGGHGYKMFRDFHLDRLEPHTPKSVPRSRD
jgi:hypothetical protein